MAKDKASQPEKPRKHIHEIPVTNGHAANDTRGAKTSKDEKSFLVQLKFVNFEKSCIYAVDVHPDGTRFAAGGMGEDSGRVCVWHVHSFKPGRFDVRLICQLDNHTACVNCLRWSNKGNFLASGAGDNLVMIWQQVRVGEAENWKRVHALHKHTADVFSLNWSPNDAMLASCGVDNTIIIWDVQKNFETVTILREDVGTVKGVTWDPIGKYLATQSDEQLRVWRTADWKTQYHVSDFFEKCRGSTQVLRLDWSTDGMNIVTAHASNEGRPIAQIIERGDGWKSVNYLAGHSRPVVCIRFNPRMFTSKDENTPYCVCATGGRDHTVAVWSFHKKRPHVFTGLFTSPVMDIAWFPDGYSLLACSLDGTIAYIHCGRLVTGSVITKEQQSQALAKLYGRTVVDAASSFIGSHNIVESSVFLDAQEAEKQRRKEAGTQEAVTQDSGPKLPYEGIPLVKQIETRLPNGRLRITPVFIPETVPISLVGMLPGVGRVPQDSSLDDRSQSSSALSEGSRPADEPVIPPVPMARPLGPAALKAASRSATMPRKPVAPEEQPVAPKKHPKGNKVDRMQSQGERENGLNGKHHTSSTLKRPAVDGVGAAPAPASSSLKRNDSVQVIAEKPVEARAPMLDSVLRKTVVRDVPSSISSVPRPEKTRRVVPMSSRKLPIPSLIPRFSVTVDADGTESNEPITLSVENEMESGNSSLLSTVKFHKIQFLIGNRIRWIQYLTSPAIVASANESVSCAVCQDLSLHIWSSESGSLLYKSQCFSSTVTHLASSKNSVFTVTADCKVDLWTRSHGYGCWKWQSLGSVEWMLRSSSDTNATVSRTSITGAEVPTVSMSDNRHFICDSLEGTWLVAHDESIRLGNYLMNSNLAHISGRIIEGPLFKLQKVRSDVTVARNVSPEIASILSMNHMEHQMLLARVLKSASEYQAWQRCYAQCLVDNDCIPRLRTLLDSLLGPPGNAGDVSGSTWEPEVLGLRKRMLLDKILPVLGRKVQFQRMYLEYKQRLELSETHSLFAI